MVRAVREPRDVGKVLLKKGRKFTLPAKYAGPGKVKVPSLQEAKALGIKLVEHFKDIAQTPPQEDAGSAQGTLVRSKRTPPIPASSPKFAALIQRCHQLSSGKPATKTSARSCLRQEIERIAFGAVQQSFGSPSPPRTPAKKKKAKRSLIKRLFG